MLKDVRHQLSVFLQNWSRQVSQKLQTIKTRLVFKLVYLQEFLSDLSGWDAKIQVYKQTFRIWKYLNNITKGHLGQVKGDFLSSQKPLAAS